MRGEVRVRERWGRAFLDVYISRDEPFLVNIHHEIRIVRSVLHSN